MEIYEIDHYAKCWSDCDKFRVLFSSASEKNENIEGDLKKFDIDSDSNSKTYEAKRDMKCDDFEFNSKDKCNLHFLPDLVSNISAATPVTPLPSPEEDVGASQKGIICDQIIQTSTTCDKTESKDLSNINIKDELAIKYCDTPLKQSDSSVLKVSTNEKFHSRLYQLVYEIYYKYINDGSCHCINLLESFKETLASSLETGNFTQDLFVPVQEKLYSYLELE